MENKASGFDVATSSRRGDAGPAEARGDKGNPRSRRANRSDRADAYAAFADRVRRDLNPRGPLESLAADHVVAASWRFQEAVEHRATRRLADRDEPDRSTQGPKKAAITAADRAAGSLKEALEVLGLARESRARSTEFTPEVPFSEALVCEVEPNEWPIVPSEGPEEPPIWRDRLVFDFDISDISPVVRGTWITVGHVVSLIVDGETWADILRSHPELSEADIRCCVAYAVAQDRDED